MMKIRASEAFRGLSAVLHCISKDETRPHLNSVSIEMEEGGIVRFVATDGHRLAVWQTKGEGKPSSVLIRLDDLKRVLRSIKGYAKDLMSDVEIDGRTITVRSSAGIAETITVAKNDEAFPPWRQVVPAGHGMAENGLKTSLNARYLSEAAEAFDKACNSKAGAMLRVAYSGALGPVMLRASNVPELTIIVMPMRDDSAFSFPAIEAYADAAE